MGPSIGRVDAASEGVVALTACRRGLLSWDLRVAETLGVVVMVCCLESGRRNVAESVTCGLVSEGCE